MSSSCRSAPRTWTTSTPHALGACAGLHEALACCKGPDSAGASVQAARSGFWASLPDVESDLDEESRLWKSPSVRKKLRKQLKVVEDVGALTRLDERAVSALRERLRGPELVGETAPVSEARACSPGLTNQQAFETYRRMVEADLRRPGPMDLPGVSGALLRFGAWSGRYSRRRQTIDGSYGRLADAAGQRAVVARNRARDASVPGRPEWAADDRMIVELAFSNPASVQDVRSPYDPHGHGPSVRRWLDGRRAGGSDAAGWEAVLAWARHRPAARAAEDRRRKKGQAQAAAALGAHLARGVAWAETGDVECPWAADVDGARWRARVNDFPDDDMCTLLTGGAGAGSFHDWPETWRRG